MIAMTEAMFNQTGSTLEVSICGHADYNPGGPDIVCSACSVLTCTLLQCVLAEEETGAYRALHTAQDDGNFFVSAECAAWAFPKIKGIFDVITSGFALLANKYPDFVKLSVRTGEK